MAISVFDLFSIGIGPSSSHTVGPMRAALTFVDGLGDDLPRTSRVQAELFGSLGATGFGHGSDKAVLLGLSGERPEEIDTDTVPVRIAEIRESGRLRLAGTHEIAFDEDNDLTMHRRKSLPAHPNGMVFRAFDASGALLRERTYYSVGGGFVRDESYETDTVFVEDSTPVPYPFRTGADLLAHCASTGLPISEIMLANELSWRSREEVRSGLLDIWAVMAECVRNGCTHEGVLPGGLKVPRRARALHEKLLAEDGADDPLYAMDWVSLYALAVNEENAAGGRVVTAPTNGAAGIIPAVLHYYQRFIRHSSDDGIVTFLLTAGAIGSILKQTGSISGAEVGCQGEVGSASAMAAAGLTEVLGGTPAQVENAAEIGVEHHLGLTCDPVGGLVQIPCIERNAVGASKAIHAARMAMRGDGSHVVTLDKAIKTMRETGADMSVKYKETARGGLAVNVIEC
ncbi:MULTISPECIES: L-serine ammonia-lyase [unclassified Amycolatopsis]|uniref:L-serine ammonia-lyase n=1 Tax=unclassified Amycolatopsis TaxID=2618356 RepID=UPI0028750BFC|nr:MULTISPECIES: L-serine ammonia-lyase [unclassified Amycolatopsis]MDS0138089.1 L-serine ammonia-lyase [Amycolatopsis sp. 505]MDS0143998.1 L-serine ammonia-lyase [Amycolatopsis sp. CM201R]